LLVKLALQEKRSDDARAWFESTRINLVFVETLRLSRCRVAMTHPDRAIENLERISGGTDCHTQVSAYPVAAQYLRQVMKTLNRLERSIEWKQYLTTLREANKRKRRLIEILDGWKEAESSRHFNVCLRTGQERILLTPWSSLSRSKQRYQPFNTSIGSTFKDIESFQP